MKIEIIQNPYDCGHKDVRQGLGPSHLLQNKIDKMLEADGHQIRITRIEAKSVFTMEVGTAFELNRLLSDKVRTAVGEGFFPVILSGNCNSCLGTIAGIGARKLGVVWFDAHGEFNTPDTTLSGFLDGMPLAMATGRCWKAVLKTIPGFKPVPESDVILVGARDLDEEEQRQLEKSDVNVIQPKGMTDEDIIGALEAALSRLQSHVSGIYLHIDMDAFDIRQGSANHLDSAGGLKPELVEDAIALVKNSLRLKGCTLASYDPSFDTKRKFLEAGMRCIRKIVSQIE